MGNPYQRQDVSNNIANGSVINADDLDAEFNALESAFNATLGHSHDGTTGEGGPITVIGPVQDFIATSALIRPKTNNAYDLGSSSFKFKDAYVDGILYSDGINFNGTAITATGVEINRLSGVTSSVQTQLDGKQPLDEELSAIAGLVSAADRLPYFTGLGTAALATFTAFGRSLVDDADAAAARTTLDLGTIATQSAASVNITGGTLTGITDLAVADGGTGVSTITGLIRGNGTAPFSAAVAGTDFLAPSAIGVTIQGFDADLSAVAGLATNGLIVRTGAGTAATRSITAGAGISITNGDGVSGNPVISAIATGLPAGAVMAFAMNSAPSGWLAADGSAVSRTTFADLFAAIGTTYGVGDGSTTFNLPDLRAEFIRGVDGGRGIDTGRVFGSAQTSQNLAHTHTGSTSTDGAHTHSVSVYNAGTATAGPVPASQPNYSSLSTSAVDTGSAGSHSHTLTINSNGGTEARPRNIAMLYCIKT